MKAYFKNTLFVLVLITGLSMMAQTPPLPPSPTNTGSSSNNSAAISNNLRIINDAFSKYNSYETVFSLNGKTLRWKSSVADISGNISDLIFYVNYTNNWIVIRCLGEECLTGTDYNTEYSMGLKTESDEISPDMSKVLKAFNDIRAEMLGK